MVPINQVILGGDPLLGSSMVGNSLDEQLQLIEKYSKTLKQQNNLDNKYSQCNNLHSIG